MIAAIGDVVEDVVVRLAEPLQASADTRATVVRRRGGSAANVAAAVAAVGHPARFIGQIGDDRLGVSLSEELTAAGVDVVGGRGGRSGSIIVVVAADGDRSMLTDRGSTTTLADPQRAWLDGVTTLHLPVYSLVVEPLAATTGALVGWAHELGLRVSIDVSSTSVITAVGVERLVTMIAALAPDVVLCNQDEAATLDAMVDPGRLGAAMTIIKRGPGPASALRAGASTIDVAATRIDDVRDTTGAGDAFAAGLLVAFEQGADAADALVAAHRSAARAIVDASSGHHVDD